MKRLTPEGELQIPQHPSVTISPTPTPAQLLQAVKIYKKREWAYMTYVANLHREVNSKFLDIKDWRINHDIQNNQLRTVMVDPTVNLEIKELRQKIAELSQALQEARDGLQAQQFGSQSIMGHRLINKCRTLQQENTELGKTSAENQLQPLTIQISQLKKHVIFLKAELKQLRELHADVDADNEALTHQLSEMSKLYNKSQAHENQLQQELESLRSQLAKLQIDKRLNAPQDKYYDSRIDREDKSSSSKHAIRSHSLHEKSSDKNVVTRHVIAVDLHKPPTSEKSDSSSHFGSFESRNAAELIEPPQYHDMDRYVEKERVRESERERRKVRERILPSDSLNIGTRDSRAAIRPQGKVVDLANRDAETSSEIVSGQDRGNDRYREKDKILDNKERGREKERSRRREREREITKESEKSHERNVYKERNHHVSGEGHRSKGRDRERNEKLRSSRRKDKTQLSLDTAKERGAATLSSKETSAHGISRWDSA